MIIDFHTHCFPDEIYERAIAKLSLSASQPPSFDGSFAGLKASMKQHGIDYSVVLNIATNAKQQPKVNDFAISINDKSNGIVSFGSVNPDSADIEGELVRLKKAGVLGIKFHPDYQSFFINEKRMYPIYEMCIMHGFIMIFHTGEDSAYIGNVHAVPAMTREVIDTLKYDKIVLAHMGGDKFWEESLELLAGRNVYLESSFGLNKMPHETANRFLDKHDSERLLFGSDAPWCSPKLALDAIDKIKMKDGAREKLYFSNAAGLLGI